MHLLSYLTIVVIGILALPIFSLKVSYDFPESDLTTNSRNLKSKKEGSKSQKLPSKSKKSAKNTFKSTKKSKSKYSKTTKESKAKKSKSKESQKQCTIVGDQDGECAVLTQSEIDARLPIKKQLFSGFQFTLASLFAARQDQSPFSFQTTEFLWFAWEIATDKISEVQEILPDGFTLSPISVSKDEEAKFYIVLNLYNVIIATNPSIRAEWSSFVKTGDDTVRFMILDAPTNVFGIEPTRCGPVPPSSVIYEVNQNIINTTIEATGGSFYTTFDLTCSTIKDDNFLTSLEFEFAAEKNYWLSGVYDKAFFTGASITSSPALSIDPESIKIEDTTYWGTLVKSETPDLVFYYTDPIDFSGFAWYNLEDIKDSQEELFNCLDSFKFDPQAGFVGISFLSAQNVLEGNGEASLKTALLGSVLPTSYLNFKIQDDFVSDLEMKILPPDFELVKIKITKDQSMDEFMMTVRVGMGGIEASPYFGFQALWIVYTRCKKTNRIYQMILDMKSNYEYFSAYDLLHSPTNFTLEREGGTIKGNIKEGSNSLFSIDLTIPSTLENATELSIDWLATHDRQYALNGVYDYFLCDSSLFDMKATLINPDDVKINDETIWKSYIESKPFQVFTVETDTFCTIQPWFNLEEVNTF